MVSAELLTTLQQLNQSYPVSSPYDAFEAANIMLKALQNSTTQKPDFFKL